MIRALAPDRADQALKNTLPGLYRRVGSDEPDSLYHVVVFGVPLERRRIVKKNIPTPASGTGSPSSQATSMGSTTQGGQMEAPRTAFDEAITLRHAKKAHSVHGARTELPPALGARDGKV